MGLGASDAVAPAADDDLVSELLAGDDDDNGEDDAALAASLLNDAQDSAPADAAGASGDFGGLDIGAVDFETPSAGGEAPADEAEDPIIDDGSMTPGTFS